MRNYNINRTYVDVYDQKLVILALELFENFSTANRLKDYSTSLLIFGRDVILPINILWIRNNYARKIKRNLIQI